jgi:hypothetical protein
MTYKKRIRTASARKTQAGNGTRRTKAKRKPQDKQGLEMTDYLLEAHPELGFPAAATKLGKSEA